jgi:hypothetical protein
MQGRKNAHEPSEDLRAQIEYMASPLRLNVVDIYQRAYFGALASVIGHSDFQNVNGLIAEQEALYPDRSPKDHAENFQRDDNNHNLIAGTPGWPWGHHVPKAKMPALEDLETNPARQALFRRNMQRNRQTNIPDRGVLFKAAELMLEQESPIKMFDMGVSRHHISKKLASPAGALFASFRPPDVMDRAGIADSNPLASWRFHNLVNGTSLPIASSIGIDIQDMLVGTTRRDHDEARKWAESCFYTSEWIHDLARIHEFNHWEDTTVPQVKFFQGDVTNFDHDRFSYNFPDARNYDVAYFSTVGYQLGEHGLKAAIDNVRPYLRKDARILLQDFVRLREDGSLDFLAKWPEWSYALYSLDLGREEEGYTKLFTAASGRIGKIAIEPVMANSRVARSLGLAASMA